MKKFLRIIILSLFSISLCYPPVISSEEKIKIGLLVPLTGEDKELGHQIVKSTRIALKDIKSNKLEIYPKDTASKANQTLKSAFELRTI